MQSYIPFGDIPLKSYSIKRYSKAEFRVYLNFMPNYNS